MSFANDVRAYLPKGLSLPDEFAAVFDWAEGRGQRGRFAYSESDDITADFMSIYSPEEMDKRGASHVLFHVGVPPVAEPIPEEITSRCATIATAAGDGGRLTLWLDPDDKQQCVIFNHGWPYVLTDDPLVALQFLAIGYSEPAALQDPAQTAAEQTQADMAEPPLMPVDYIAFLADQFGVTVPERASDLGISIPLDDDLTDPSRIWLEANTPQEDPKDVPGMTAENPYVITAELAAALGADGVAALQENIEFVVIEE